MRSKYNLVITILGATIILTSFIFLLLHHNYFPIPNWDVFDYIADSRIYMSLHLPKDIYGAPGNPIIIGLVSKLIKFTDNYELINVIFLNIIFSTLSIFIFWKLSENIYGKYFLVLLILILTNYLYYDTVLKGTSEIFFTFFIFLVIYLWQNKLYKYSYFTAGISFLFRYEAIAILSAMIFIDIIKKRLKNNFPSIILGIIPVISIFSVIYFRNPGGNILHNHYIIEIFKDFNSIPNINIILTIPTLLFRDVIFNNNYFVALFYSYFAYSIYLIIKKDKEDLLLITGIIVAYIFIHLIFPPYEKRYIFPIIGLTYTVLFWPIYLVFLKENHKKDILLLFNKYLILSFVIFMSMLNSFTFNKELESERFSGIEVILLSDWLNKRTFSQKVYVVAFPRWALEYYNNNKNVIYLKDELKDESPNFIVAYDSFIQTNYTKYTFLRSVQAMLEVNKAPDEHGCRYVTTLRNRKKWVKIYSNMENVF